MIPSRSRRCVTLSNGMVAHTSDDISDAGVRLALTLMVMARLASITQCSGWTHAAECEGSLDACFELLSVSAEYVLRDIINGENGDP